MMSEAPERLVAYKRYPVVLDDPAALASLKKRWENGPAVYDILANAKVTGHFSLQHHSDRIWFKNIRIKE